jgi:hypothetical protein
MLFYTCLGELRKGKEGFSLGGVGFEEGLDVPF